jgi:hypothetical protein
MSADRWDAPPERANIDHFLRTMGEHTQVREITTLSANRYDLSLIDGEEVKVFVTNVYDLTAADYAELHERHPDVNCIVQGSSWNYFTSQAKEDAHRDGIATLRLGRQLMGALHRRGRAFVTYSEEP